MAEYFLSLDDNGIVDVVAARNSMAKLIDVLENANEREGLG